MVAMGERLASTRYHASIVFVLRGISSRPGIASPAWGLFFATTLSRYVGVGHRLSEPGVMRVSPARVEGCRDLEKSVSPKTFA